MVRTLVSSILVIRTERDPPPGWFLRKNVIPGELEATKVQECDSKAFAGWAARFTRELSTDYTSCQ